MNVYLLSSIILGLDILEFLNGRVPVKGVIGLTERKPTDRISGFIYMEPYCLKNNLDFVGVESYGLKNENDRLLALEIDLLLVCWQRLVPSWLIEHCRVGAIGIHGSHKGITSGRGRSPQNWALIMGEKEFEVSIYFIDPGIDSGDVIASRKIPLTPLDDIRTSYCKVAWAAAEMLVESWENKSILERKARKQTGMPGYLPQRLPEDGEIDWNRSSEEIYDFVRALTRPYPGAFSCLSSQALMIVWRGRPFKVPDRFEKFLPGEVIALLSRGEIVVKTHDSAFLIDDYEVSPSDSLKSLKQGTIFNSADFNLQMARIRDRHQGKYPDLPLSEDILSLKSSGHHN